MRAGGGAGIERRIVLAGALAAARPAMAQTLPRVGFLIAGDPEPPWALFRNAMAALGYVEGRSIAYEYRAGPADSAKLEPLVQSMIDAKVEILLATADEVIE